MAYDDTQLFKMGEIGNGRAMWAYHTLDTAATVDTDSYFTVEALKKLVVGSIIHRITWATAIRTGTVSTYGIHIVLTNDGATMDVTDSTVGLMTDTD
jgi:hypothetical protein